MRDTSGGGGEEPALFASASASESDDEDHEKWAHRSMKDEATADVAYRAEPAAQLLMLNGLLAYLNSDDE
jgi:hypothetical protein